MKSLLSIGLALSSIRSRFFHTFLSILGIIIGVAALVATLSLIDGLEAFAKEQIQKNTPFQSIRFQVNTTKEVNGVRMRKDSFPIFTFATLDPILRDKEEIQQAMVRTRGNGEITLIHGEDSIVSATYFNGIARWGEPLEPDNPYRGRMLEKEDYQEARKVCMINEKLASSLLEQDSLLDPLGKILQTPLGELEIVGVGTKKEKDARPQAFVPIGLFPEEDLKASPPIAMVEVKDITQVNPVKDSLLSALQATFQADEKDFRIETSANIVRQAEQGFLLFRIVMGMIVGLSVLVGGIGIMNVMLIVVRDRTPEIGISKAMGARRRDIFVQYLTESITISSIGSLIGLVLGILTSMLFVFIAQSFSELPFDAAYTVNTMIIIAVIAILIGVAFGTYPALKASRLDPVEAMRRE